MDSNNINVQSPNEGNHQSSNETNLNFEAGNRGHPSIPPIYMQSYADVQNEIIMELKAAENESKSNDSSGPGKSLGVDMMLNPLPEFPPDSNMLPPASAASRNSIFQPGALIYHSSSDNLGYALEPDSNNLYNFSDTNQYKTNDKTTIDYTGKGFLPNKESNNGSPPQGDPCYGTVPAENINHAVQNRFNNNIGESNISGFGESPMLPESNCATFNNLLRNALAANPHYLNHSEAESNSNYSAFYLQSGSNPVQTTLISSQFEQPPVPKIITDDPFETLHPSVAEDIDCQTKAQVVYHESLTPEQVINVTENTSDTSRSAHPKTTKIIGKKRKGMKVGETMKYFRAHTAHFVLKRNDDGSLPTGILECDLCRGLYGNKKSLDSHSESCHKKNKNRYKCTFCDQVLKSKTNRDRHESNNHKGMDERGTNVFHCHHCAADFSTKLALTRHTKEAHREEYNTPPKVKKTAEMNSKSRKMYVCRICGTSCSFERNNMNRHIKVVHYDRKDFRCPDCGSYQCSQNNLDVHKLTCKSKRALNKLTPRKRKEKAKAPLTFPPSPPKNLEMKSLYDKFGNHHLSAFFVGTSD